jgi:hypothetical protein
MQQQGSEIHTMWVMVWTGVLAWELDGSLGLVALAKAWEQEAPGCKAVG